MIYRRQEATVSNIDSLALAVTIAMTLGVVAFLVAKKTKISFVPILIILGIIFGPALGFINRSIAHHLFNYVRVVGLVVILFTEGHNLKWHVVRKQLATIGVLDTVGLFVTAFIAAFFFSWFFHVPFLAGLLFGAIISATDPATLIPLFKQHRVKEDMRTIIVTESIFNDPLGIVLTILAVALLVPQAPSAKLVETIAHYTTLYPAAVIYFLYVVILSIGIGIALGLIGYRLMEWLKLDMYPEVYSLALAFAGFLIGEWLHTSGYLVAAVIGMVMGNTESFFSRAKPSPAVLATIGDEVHFNEILSNFATIFIFILLGASLDLTPLFAHLLMGAAIAFVVILIARPIAGLAIKPVQGRSWREYLFISLEGPRGVVPAALASLPLTLGQTYHNAQLINWGEIILAATVITVLISVIVETVWVSFLSRKLLEPARQARATKTD
jgi:potassium/hydrogen antiporter